MPDKRVGTRPEYPGTPVERALTLQPLVRKHADQSERNRHLMPEVAHAFAENGLYRIGAPLACLGEEADPATQIRTIEAISRADGSAGWNLMIGIESFGLSAPGFTHCMDLVADPMVVMCGSTAAVGRADKVAQGYRISGHWQFVSGCHNSRLFGATVRVFENDQPMFGKANRTAMIKAPDFTIVDTWNVSGMCGSGSHDVVVDNVLIDDTRLVAPIGGHSGDSPLLRFPSAARLAYNKVAVALGIAQAAIDAFVGLATNKVPRFSNAKLRDRDTAQRAIAQAEVRVRGARALLFECVNTMWRDVCAEVEVSRESRAIFQIACSDAVQGCAQAVDQLADAAGTTANQIGHPLERLCRDSRVVRQHVTVANHHITDGGRVLLGLEAQGVMLAGLG